MDSNVVPPQLQMGYNPMKTSSIYHQHSYHREIGQTFAPTERDLANKGAPPFSGTQVVGWLPAPLTMVTNSWDVRRYSNSKLHNPHQP